MHSDSSNLAKRISQTCTLKGEFVLRSGLKSQYYFDKYLMESSPELLNDVAQALLPLIPKQTDCLAALEMGGIPLGTALSLKTNLPCYFVRKQAKSYGTKQICEGGSIKNKNLCIIEDVITTGGQVKKSVTQLRQLGANITNVLCVILRSDDPDLFQKEQLNLAYLFHKKNLLDPSI